MLLKDLLQDIKYTLVGAMGEEMIKSVVTDAREICDGCLYIALKGETHLQNIRGARATVILQTPPEKKLPYPYVLCEDVRAAMAYIYSRFYEIDYNSLSFIGITGTNGKSSTLTLTAAILRANGYAVGCIKTGEISINGRVITDDEYSMTTPDPRMLYKAIRQMQNEGCDHVIMEVSSHSLALSKVAPIFFDYAIFTGLSPEHLDFHKSMEEYYQAKKKLFSACRCAVINIDDDYGARLYSEINVKKISFGVTGDADAYIDDYENLGFEGHTFKFRLRKKQIDMRVPLVGCYNVYNALASAVVGTDMEIPEYYVRDAIRNTKCIVGRFQILSSMPTVIVDYAHTARAFEAFLHELSKLKNGRSLTVIFGCGGERDKSKRSVMGSLAELYADRIILTSDNSRSENPMDIIRDILGGISAKPVCIDTNRAHTVEKSILSAEDDEIIAIIGKGAEKYSIDASGYKKYDEIALIEKALLKRSAKNENKA